MLQVDDSHVTFRPQASLLTREAWFRESLANVPLKNANTKPDEKVSFIYECWRTNQSVRRKRLEISNNYLRRFGQQICNEELPCLLHVSSPGTRIEEGLVTICSST